MKIVIHILSQETWVRPRLTAERAGETVRQAKVSEPLYLSEQEEGLGEEGGDYANGWEEVRED